MVFEAILVHTNMRTEIMCGETPGASPAATLEVSPKAPGKFIRGSLIVIPADAHP